jgi:hypothetical protein
MTVTTSETILAVLKLIFSPRECGPSFSRSLARRHRRFGGLRFRSRGLPPELPSIPVPDYDLIGPPEILKRHHEHVN